MTEFDEGLDGDRATQQQAREAVKRYRERTTGANRVKNLIRSIRADRHWMKRYREQRVAMLADICGADYAEPGESHDIPYPLLFQTLDVYTMFLAYRNPEVMIVPSTSDSASEAILFEAAINQHIKDCKMVRALRHWLRDALLGIGVLKVGPFADYYPTIYEDGVYDTGSPSCAVVDLDDYFFDRNCTSIDELTYEGNCYTLPAWYLLENRRYKRAVVEKVILSARERNVERGPISVDDDDGDVRRADELTNVGGEAGGDESLEIEIPCMDVYDHKDGVMLTLARGVSGNPVLEEREQDGPPPYAHLFFSELPQNAFPLPPLWVLRPLHAVVNAVGRKLSDQARRSKTLFLTTLGSEQDAEAIREADDGSIIPVMSKDAVTPATVPGPDGGLFAYRLQSTRDFNAYAGNIEAAAGLGSQADTATQEQLVVAQASQRFQWLQNLFSERVTGVLDSVAWHIMRSPTFKKTVRRGFNGPQRLSFNVEFSPSDMKSLSDYGLDLVPMSMQPQSPGQMLQAMNQLAVVAERFAPHLAAQGGQIDVRFVVAEMARLMGISHLLDGMFTFSGMPVGTGRNEEPPSPGRRTNSTYTRRSVSAGRQGNQDSAMIAGLLNRNTGGQSSAWGG